MKIWTPEDFDQLIALLPSTAENNELYQALIAARNEQSVIRQPWSFEVDFSTGAGLLAGQFAAPAPGAQTVGNFLVDTAAPFMLIAGSFRADLAGAAQTEGARISPNCTVLIQDQASNRNWSNVGVPVTSLFGANGGLPFFWPQPRLIPANTTVQVTLANYEAVNTPNVRLTFHGFRLYSQKA